MLFFVVSASAGVSVFCLLDGSDVSSYYELEGTVMPLLKNDHQLINDLAARIQQILYEKASLGLKPIRPALEEDRAENLINAISDAGDIEQAKNLVDSSLVDLVQHFDDKFIEENVRKEYNSGLRRKIKREQSGGACKWCRSLAGTYDYPDVPEDVYRRHQNCRCLVTYDPGDGRRRDIHSKKWVSEEREQAERGLEEINSKQTLEEKTRNIYTAFMEKDLDVEEIIDRVNKSHEWFKGISPEEMYKFLNMQGYEVKSLNKGDFIKVPFWEGGGFRISFGGDGYFQYHPRYKTTNPHHESPYWKIGNGKRGIKRYGMDGRAIS